ncbi:MAG TPA: glycerophosphodiester phosphodiesterase family protein [Candidatus Didemnitutus sp.]|jgi:glycerophosphoryl diester phosphodiesterase
MKTHRLLPLVAFAGCLAATLAPARDAKPYRLIAHRGGIVEDQFPDNCAGALQAAVARGYWMVETDIRETKDGVLVMHHDPDFNAYFHDPRRVIDLTWDEIPRLHSDLGDQHPWRFEDLVRAAHDAGIRLMLDSKDPHTAGFCEKVEAILRAHDMLARCYIIGTADALKYFTGKAPVGLKFPVLKSRLAADPAAAKYYFLFDEGSMTPDTVRWAQARGIKVVPSVNIYHYYDPKTMAGKSRAALKPVIFAAAQRDIEKFKALGVTEFQIDSEFDRWLQSP